MAFGESKELIVHLIKYTAISGLSLSIDLAVFQTFTDAHLVSIPQASTISYICGLLFAYVFFIYSIFSDSRYSQRKLLQIGLFGLSGLIGSISTFIISATTSNLLDASKWQSKLSAVLCSFILGYLFRMKIVFPNED